MTLPPGPRPAEEDAASPLQRQGMRNAVLLQCAGVFGKQVLESGVVLLYLNRLGADSVVTMLLLAVPWACQVIFTLFAAYVGDRIGRKRMALRGLYLYSAGLAGLVVAGVAPGAAEALAFLSLALYGIGYALFAANWFGLLSAIVPESMRGRFFGRLRVSWQIVGIAFMAVCALLLSQDSPVWAFQVVLGAAALSNGVRILLFRRMPELERPRAGGNGFLPSLLACIRTPGYMPFTAYVFLLMLFTSSSPVLFGLLQKTVLGFGDNEVVWLGNLMLAGMVAGFFLGGRTVDRVGTKSAFLVCHFGFALALPAVLARSFVPLPMVVYLGAVQFFFGLFGAVSSIAISSEMLALIPKENKSLATSLCTTLQQAGKAISGLLYAWAIKIGFLRETWTLRGAELSHYDTLLLGCGVMVLLLVVTLGLVPSVIRKAEWIPRDG